MVRFSGIVGVCLDRFMSEAGVAGATFDLPFCKGRASISISPFEGGRYGERNDDFVDGAGGGGMSTSVSGSGDIESVELLSRLEVPDTSVYACLRACVLGDNVAAASTSSGVAKSGGGAFRPRCGFILGDSLTTRAGFRVLPDFLRCDIFIAGLSFGSTGEVELEYILFRRPFCASSAGELSGEK